MNFIGLCIFSTAEDTSCKKHVGSFSMSSVIVAGHKILHRNFKKDWRRWAFIFQSFHGTIDMVANDTSKDRIDKRMTICIIWCLVMFTGR